VLGWVGAEIFRQAPPIPKEVVTTDGRTVVAAGDISNGQNVWQAMGGNASGFHLGTWQLCGAGLDG
jgi:nitric oxide reductase subunit B